MKELKKYVNSAVLNKATDLADQGIEHRFSHELLPADRGNYRAVYDVLRQNALQLSELKVETLLSPITAEEALRIYIFYAKNQGHLHFLLDCIGQVTYWAAEKRRKAASDAETQKSYKKLVALQDLEGHFVATCLWGDKVRALQIEEIKVKVLKMFKEEEK